MSFEFLSLETIQKFAHDYGYWAIFLGILLENLGIPLPGETITIAGGFLAGSGELNYWFVRECDRRCDCGRKFRLCDRQIRWLATAAEAGKIFPLWEEQLFDLKEQFSKNAAKAVFLGVSLHYCEFLLAP